MCPKRVILKVIFISVRYQENEVFHKSFALFFLKSKWGLEQSSKALTEKYCFICGHCLCTPQTLSFANAIISLFRKQRSQSFKYLFSYPNKKYMLQKK